MKARGAALFVLAAVTACGGGTPGVESTSTVARATEPRTNDPTAAAAAPLSTATGRPPPTAGAAQPSTTSPSPTSPGPKDPNAAAKSETSVPDKISARHVLVMYMGSQRAPASIVRTRDQARALAEEVLRRARAGDDVARLAVEYSDEPGAGGRGGSLGRFGKGAMVPAFEEAVFKLKVGEISDVVETPFGFHVIQRTE